MVVGGHQRLRIARENGMKTIPCVEVNLSLDAERELNVRLNQNSGEWDWDKLANEFDMAELVDWGFDSKSLDVSNSFLREVSDIEMLDDDYENYSMNFIVGCSNEEELDAIKGMFGTNKKKISFETAKEVMCQSQ